jgi:hypothetical protein
MDETLNNMKKMKKRLNIISEIRFIKTKVKFCNCNAEKTKYEDRIKELKTMYMKLIDVVGECEGYEMENGLLGMKRDINNKLTFFLNDEKIREVLFY